MTEKSFNRIPVYNAFDLQKNTLIEEFVKNNFGKVCIIQHQYKCDDENVTTIEKLVEAINNNVKYDTYFSKSENEFCWALKDSFIADVDVSKQRTYGNECSELAAISDTEIEFSNVKHIMLTLYCLKDTDNSKNFTSVFSSCGFIKLAAFEAKNSEIPVTFAFPTASGLEYETNSFAPITLSSIEMNYLPETIDKAKEFVSLCKTKKHGIFVLNGPVGTGKSYLIKAILSELKTTRNGIVCSPPVEFLTQAGLLNTVVYNFKKSLIIFEDIGELVAIDSASRYENARANLLNISEGLMSILLDGIFVISFNYDIDKIDPAILRPGRCLGHITTNKLPYKQVKNLINFEVPEKSYSLAEVYEMKNSGKMPENKKITSMGFSI